MTVVANDTIEFLPVWNLKPEVTAASDVDNGLYSLKISAYGSHKLRTFVRSMVAHRTAMQSDSTKAFNLYINDGSLPFGGSFSGVHNTHNTGNILDMRPLGNTGSTSQHYDFASGSKRIADLAVVWAESIYRNEQCNSLTRESAEHIACEATATTHFQTEFDIDHPSDTFQTKRARLVRWINLNQQLGSIPMPAGTKSLQFKFSDGLRKFSSLCEAMVTAYQSGTAQLVPAEGCEQKIDHSPFDESDIQFQLSTKLPSGILPNGDAIPGTLQQSTFTNSRLKKLQIHELLHYDHFHLEINE
ncbi:MAG: hypothetical protein IPJ84_11275 [Bdellovibrionales bacterium]|nr:hypothetical protein [Bdellovibrionales bacterium]